MLNIFMNDLLFLIDGTEICNYADDTTLYTCDKRIENVLENLKINASSITTWFSENQMKMNENKCCLLMLGGNKEPVTLDLGSVKIDQSNEEKLLGMIIRIKILTSKHTITLQKSESKTWCIISNSSLHESRKGEVDDAILHNITIQLQSSNLDVPW